MFLGRDKSQINKQFALIFQSCTDDTKDLSMTSQIHSDASVQCQPTQQSLRLVQRKGLYQLRPNTVQTQLQRNSDYGLELACLFSMLCSTWIYQIGQANSIICVMHFYCPLGMCPTCFLGIFQLRFDNEVTNLSPQIY